MKKLFFLKRSLAKTRLPSLAVNATEITTLDVVRADKFVHEMTGAPMSDVSVPVIGASVFFVGSFFDPRPFGKDY